jgi:hypothetical protein
LIRFQPRSLIINLKLFIGNKYHWLLFEVHAEMIRPNYYVMSTFIIIIAILLLPQPNRASINKPRVISAVSPVYPVLAAVANIGGIVEIEVKVSNLGDVSSVQAVQGHSLLRQAAESAARRWRFERSDNTSEVRVLSLIFVFRIMQKDTIPDELTPVFEPPYQLEIRHLPFKPVVDADPPTFTRPSGQRRTKQKQGKEKQR